MNIKMEEIIFDPSGRKDLDGAEGVILFAKDGSLYLRTPAQVKLKGQPWLYLDKEWEDTPSNREKAIIAAKEAVEITT